MDVSEIDFEVGFANLSPHPFKGGTFFPGFWSNRYHFTQNVNWVSFAFPEIHGDLKIRLRDKLSDKDFFKLETLEDLSNLLTRVGLIEEDEEYFILYIFYFVYSLLYI